MCARRLIPTLVLLLAAATAAAQERTDSAPATADPTGPGTFSTAIEVVGVTPIQGLGVARDKVPVAVQTITGGDASRTPAGQVPDALERQSASVRSSATQGSAFQPDLQFRGFTASPILGLPQGVAVYQDGVRVNEPFGDTVNWDLLPASAIDRIDLTPGSNPLFGLNALGGALAVATKTGFTSQGLDGSLQSGAFGRTWADIAAGGHRDRVAYFVAGRLLAEDGWRDFSPSSIRQLFARVEWQTESTGIVASASGADNRLVGNGPAPVRLLDDDRSAVFTHPDETRTGAALFTVTARHQISDTLRLDALGYHRPTTVRTRNGDASVYVPCAAPAPADALCEEGAATPLVDRDGAIVHAGGAPLDATMNTSRTRNRGWGAGVQFTSTAPWFGRGNHLLGGISIDSGRSTYQAATELARLTATRGAIGAGIFDAAADVLLRTRVTYAGVYAADFLDLTPRLTISGSARFTHNTLTLRDQLGTDLNGDHRFTRLNPAGGLTYATGVATVYGGISLGSRVPTPSELSCADPEDPCRLPNAFAADPPLRQVTAHTWEGGVRGVRRSITWSGGAFRTISRDDIVFVSSGALSNEGHFENVDRTIRDGVELSSSGPLGGSLRWSAAYTLLRARFGSPLVLSSVNHPEAIDGEIPVPAGATLPLVPRHNLRLAATVVRGRVTVDGNVLYSSSQFLRGDEANLLDPIPGFAVANVTGRYALAKRVSVVGSVANLFDRTYETFGLLGDAGRVLGDADGNPRFLSPGAPRAVWAGVEVRLR